MQMFQWRGGNKETRGGIVDGRIWFYVIYEGKVIN